MKKAEAYWPLILLLAIVKFLLPLFLQSPVYELQRDEFLYYQQGQNFDWGYLENPPLLSYLASISSWFGGSEAWVKFWPCLFGAATVIITCLIAAELGGRLFAQLLAGMSIIMGAFLRVHYLFQPNFLDIFFWTLALYAIIRYINSNHGGNQAAFLYLFSASLGLGFLSKYSIVFFGVALLVSLVVSRHRKIFLEKKLYLGALIAFVIILQNIVWQYQHNWPVVHHMKELRETQLRYINTFDFIKDQFLMTIPVVFIWTGGVIWLIKQKEWRFLALTYALVIILLIAGSGKNYYSLGIYPALFAAGGVAWERWTLKIKWPRYALIIFAILTSLLFLPLSLPIWEPGKLASFYKKAGIDKSGLLKWEDLKDHELPQDFADMLGWKELTEKSEKFYNSLPDSTKSSTIIYGRHYGHAGSLKFYGKGEEFKRFVFSDNGSFLLWFPVSARFSFSHLLFIGRRMPGTDDEVFQHFEKVTIIDSVTNQYSRQHGDKIIFFENIDSSGLRLAREGLLEMQRQFRR